MTCSKFKWRGLFWFDKKEEVRPEVEEMLQRHSNGHFIPIHDFTLLQDMGSKLGLRIPRTDTHSVSRWSDSKMRQTIHSFLAHLDPKAVRYAIGSLLHQISLNEDAKSVLVENVTVNSEDRSELIGWIYLEQGKIEQAIRHAKQAVELCQKAQKCRLKEHDFADAVCTEAYVYIFHGEPSKAVNVLESGFEHIPDGHPARARILFTQGDAYFELDQLGEALNKYELALKEYDENGMLDALPRCYNQLGKVCLDQGDLKKAKTYYESVLRYSQRLDDIYHESCAWANIGELDWYFGDAESAAKKVKKCIKLENDFMRNWIENATTCEIYAKILIDLPKVVEAEKEVQRGLNLIGNARPSQRICLYGVQVHICGLNPDRWSEGEHYVLEGLNLLETTAESKYDVQWFFLYSAEFYLKRNLLNEADNMLKRVAGTLGDRGSYVKAFYFYLLSLLCERKGDRDSVKKHCKCCMDVIHSCEIKPSWISLLPA